MAGAEIFLRFAQEKSQIHPFPFFSSVGHFVGVFHEGRCGFNPQRLFFCALLINHIPDSGYWFCIDDSLKRGLIFGKNIKENKEMAKRHPLG